MYISLQMYATRSTENIYHMATLTERRISLFWEFGSIEPASLKHLVNSENAPSAARHFQKSVKPLQA